MRRGRDDRATPTATASAATSTRPSGSSRSIPTRATSPSSAGCGRCTLPRAGDYVEAERLGQEALELSEELPNEHGQAWWAIAEARAGAGDPDADEAFRHAIDVLHEHGTVRNYANVLRAYGRYLREVGREREALDVFERAADVASNLQGEPTTAER